MGIRRRRKKLTTVITAVDRRLKTVESRVVPTRIAANAITAVELAPDAIPTTDPKDSGATGATPSETDPSEFAVITAAAYSAKNITGGDDWISITTSQPHNLSVGDKVTIYGLNNSNVNADGNYTITEVGSSTTFRYKVGLTGYYPTVVNLAVSATVTQRSCTLTEATLVLSSSTHGYAVGEVITVSGVDDAFNGTFFVSYVNGSTIKYKFIVPVSTSVSITASSGSVQALAHKYTIIGDTWIDTSVTPNVYKIWDGLSWQLGTSLPDGVIVNDYMAPAAPTGLSADTNGYYNPNTGSPSVAVTLTWTAPTTNADSTPLTDLAGYKVFYRYNIVSSPEDGSDVGDPSNEWILAGDTNETTLSMRDFNIASTIDFAVQAYDSSRMNYSVYSSPLSVDTGTPALVLNPPSTPTVEARLGTITVKWDGNDNTASTPPPTLDYVNVYLGSSSNFVPGPATLKGQITGTGADSLVITGLTYGTTYYAKLIFVSTTGSTTAASAASTSVTVVALVDTDVIGKVISGAKIVNGSITASDAIIGNTITGNLIQSNTIEAGSIKTNSLTADQISAGAITAVKIATDAVTADKIQASAITATKIATNAITADKVQAGAITADKLTAGTLTGFNIQTASSGTRVVMNGSSLTFYNSSDQLSGNIYGSSNTGVADIRIESGTSYVSVSPYGIELYNGFAEFLDVKYGSWLTTSTIFLSSAIYVEIYTDAADQWTTIGGGQGLKIQSGSPTGQAKLQVDGSSSFTGNATFNGSLIRSSMTGTGNAYAYVNANGAFLRGASVPSDRRLKTNITDTRLGLNFINKLEAVEFNFIDQTNSIDRGAQFGVIAQDVIVAMEASGVSEKNGLIYKMIQEDGVEDEFYSINHAQLISPLIKAVQELSTRIESLESK